MTVLVVGGFGFLGGRVATHLSGLGHRVIVGGRSLDGLKPSWFPGLTTVRIDLMDAESVRSACRNVDAVVHAAGTSALDSIRDPERAAAVNDVGTRRLMDACAAVGVSRVVYLSTAHVYGSPLKGHLTEASPLANSHPYATTHALGEAHVSRFNGISRAGVILRLSNVFGAPVAPAVPCWNLLINDLCRQAVTTGVLQFSSTGTAQRDFLAIADFLKAVELFLCGPVPQSRLLNIGQGVSHSVMDMAVSVARCAERVLGRPMEVRPGHVSDPAAVEPFVYDTGRANAAGWLPSADRLQAIDELLRACIGWWPAPGMRFA